MTRFETTGRSRWRRVLVFSTALVAVLGGASPGGGYLLWHSIRESFHPQFAGHIGGWHPAAWPPGATLSVALAEDGWDASTLDIRSVEDAKRGLDHALSLWSSVERADIRWKVDRVAPLRELYDDPPREFGDHDGIIVQSGDAPCGICAILRLTRAFPQTEMTSCVVQMGRSGWSYKNFLFVLVHELGHCLGLDHPAHAPFNGKTLWFLREDFVERGRLPIWGFPAYMFGGSIPLGEPPSLDDQVAVSLLRPRPGWLGGTGAIWGGVFLGDEKARGVYVLASPVAPGTDQVGPGVGAFTDRFGIFEIKGLDPGEYTLWVFDADGHRLAPWLTPQWEATDPESHIFDTIWSAPVVVSAGGRTGPLMIPVERPEWGE